MARGSKRSRGETNRTAQPPAIADTAIATVIDDDDDIAAAQKAGRPPKADLARIAAESTIQRSDRPYAGALPLVMWFASQADEMPSWWSPARDAKLRSFWKDAPFLPGAIYSIAGRNAAFRFELEGPDRAREWTKELFAHADLGGGWQRLIMKLTQDLLTQDNGAFIEVIRPARIQTSKGLLEAVKIRDDADGTQRWAVIDKGAIKEIDELGFIVTDNPQDPPVGLAHLDAGKCRRTGDLDHPVVYTDPNNRKHRLAYWQVISLEDMAAPEQDKLNVGFCAVSRVLKSAQILRDVAIYRHEKISGRFARRIYLTNVDPDDIQDRIKEAQNDADNMELGRYMQPIVVATLDPNADPKVAAMDLASLPDGFDEDVLLRWYITEVAMGTGTDYSFYAPITGGRLGSGAETEVQERTSKGKSSRLFMEMIQFKLNYGGVMPDSVRMRFKEFDPGEEFQTQRAAQARAQTRAQMLTNLEITPEVARQMAVDAGDLPARYLALMQEKDLTPDRSEEPSEGEEPEEPEAKNQPISEGEEPDGKATEKKG